MPQHSPVYLPLEAHNVCKLIRIQRVITRFGLKWGPMHHAMKCRHYSCDARAMQPVSFSLSKKPLSKRNGVQSGALTEFADPDLGQQQQQAFISETDRATQSAALKVSSRNHQYWHACIQFVSFKSKFNFQLLALWGWKIPHDQLWRCQLIVAVDQICNHDILVWLQTYSLSWMPCSALFWEVVDDTDNFKYKLKSKSNSTSSQNLKPTWMWLEFVQGTASISVQSSAFVIPHLDSDIVWDSLRRIDNYAQKQMHVCRSKGTCRQRLGSIHWRWGSGIKH